MRDPAIRARKGVESLLTLSFARRRRQQVKAIGLSFDQDRCRSELVMG